MKADKGAWLHGPHTMVQSLVIGLAAAAGLLALALAIGLVGGRWVATLSLIGTSVVLEAQPAAVASIPLGFPPFTGALVSIVANLIPIPVMLLTLKQIERRWHWFRRKLEKAERWTSKYFRYGVWMVIPLTPVLGAYVCLALCVGMRWRLSGSLACVLAGVVSSTFALTYGGHFIARLFH